MKKWSMLFMLLACLMISAVTFAADPYQNGVNDDGVLIWGTTGSGYSNVPGINRDPNFTADTDANGKGQTAQLTVEALAYIPCYLKLEFNGNDGTSKLESFGPKKDGTNLAQALGSIPGNAGAYHIVFDNELGGFVASDWTSLGHGRNAEVAPDSGVFIQACDIFHVKVWSNDDFKYDVISAPLMNGSLALNMEMGTSATIDGTYNSVTFDTAKTVNIGTGTPCTGLEYFHRFRVPYSTTTIQGGYSGTVTFKAYTI